MAGKRILVVDDEPANRQLMVRVLQHHGYEALTAGDAATALSVLEVEHVDVAVLDLGMPDVDGIALTRRLRADPRWRSLPVIAWSGSVDEPDVARALAAGCDDFLPKPIDIALIPIVLDRHLGRRAADASPVEPRGTGG